MLCPGIVKTGLLESSQRHRADAFGGPGEPASSEGMDSVIESGSDPAEIGNRVLEGIQSGDFYIFTHPGLRPAFEKRWNEIMKSYPT